MNTGTVDALVIIMFITLQASGTAYLICQQFKLPLGCIAPIVLALNLVSYYLARRL